MKEWIKLNKGKAAAIASAITAALGAATWADAWKALGQLIGVGG